MPNNPISRAWQVLCDLNSFIRSDALESTVIKREILSPGESLAGIYLNDADDFIVITDKSLHWIVAGVHRCIPYAVITEVRSNKDERTLQLRLIGEELIKLNIANDSDDISDLEQMHEFVAAVVYWPLVADENDSVRAIESREDLLYHLSGNEQLFSNYGETILALRAGFPSAWQLQQFGVSPCLLSNPETWRLLAMFLSIRQAPYRDEYY